MPGLYAEHSFAMLGGDPLPIGVWKQMHEDEKGLHGVGKISALDSDHGKRIYGLMRDGALTALSIAYSIRDGGVDYGKKAGDPKRWLNSLVLFSADIVSNPANPEAQISAIKSVMALGDRNAALAALNAALTLHSATLAGGDAPTADERAQLHDHLRAAYRALTGDEPKTAPETIRDYEAGLREKLHFSYRQARALADGGWKAACQPRDEAASAAEAKNAIKTIAEALRGLTFAA
jgi:HK97 family phage prohead protease